MKTKSEAFLWASCPWGVSVLCPSVGFYITFLKQDSLARLCFFTFRPLRGPFFKRESMIAYIKGRGLNRMLNKKIKDCLKRENIM